MDSQKWLEAYRGTWFSFNHPTSETHNTIWFPKWNTVNHTYGFHREFLRNRSTVNNSIISNLSSTSPSSNIALHAGPRRGSCNTLIGVMAKSSGTTNITPDFQRKQYYIFSFWWSRHRAINIQMTTLST